MIAEQFDAFFLDLDGVVYLGNNALPGAVDSVARLRKKEKELRFLTNDPRPTRASVMNNLHDLGIEARKREIVTSGWATARHLSDCGVSSTSVVGSDGLRHELREADIDISENDPDAVVVGADTDTSYRDIRRATRHIDNGARFIGTNPDGSFPTPEGPAPGAGAVVKAVEYATGVEPTVVGKPEQLMFEIAIESLTSDLDTVVVGDNEDTDVLGAHRAGLTGILVAQNHPSTLTPRDFRNPDMTVAALEGLFTTETERWTEPPYQWPSDIRPGVGAVVLNDSNDVLLVKRADNQYWGLPTGKVEPCESLIEAIIREVREETAVRISVEELAGIYSKPEQQVFAYPSGEAIHFVTSCFLCSHDSGTPTANEEEVLDVSFYDIRKLPERMLSVQQQWIRDALGPSDFTDIR